MTYSPAGEAATRFGTPTATRAGFPQPQDEALDALRATTEDLRDLQNQMTKAVQDAVDVAMGVLAMTCPDGRQALELRQDRDHKRTHCLVAVQFFDLLGPSRPPLDPDSESDRDMHVVVGPSAAYWECRRCGLRWDRQQSAPVGCRD